MNTDRPEQGLRAAQRRLLAAWGACSAAALLLPALAWPLVERAVPGTADAVTPGAAHALAIALAAASLIARIRLLSDTRLGHLLERHGGDESAIARLPAWLWPAFALGWAANLLVATTGMALAGWTARPQDMLPFVFAAFVLNMLACPLLAPHLRRARSLLGRGPSRTG